MWPVTPPGVQARRRGAGDEAVSREVGLSCQGAGRGEKLHGLCEGPDGRLYCAPHNASQVLVIDPTAETVAFLPGERDFATREAACVRGAHSHRGQYSTFCDYK